MIPINENTEMEKFIIFLKGKGFGIGKDPVYEFEKVFKIPLPKDNPQSKDCHISLSIALALTDRPSFSSSIYSLMLPLTIRDKTNTVVNTSKRLPLTVGSLNTIKFILYTELKRIGFHLLLEDEKTQVIKFLLGNREISMEHSTTDVINIINLINKISKPYNNNSGSRRKRV